MPGSVVVASSGAGVLYQGPASGVECTWTIGAAGSTTQLFDLLHDGDPGLTYTNIFGASPLLPCSLAIIGHCETYL